MTARDKFKIGDRVKLSAEGRAFDINPRSEKVGIVTGFGYDGESVGIRLDGNKTTRSYHADFWEMAQ